VVVIRGHHANTWELRPLERLADDYDISVLVTGSNLHEVDSVGLDTVPVRTPRDFLPRGRAAGALAYLAGERYLRLEDELAGAAIVHSAEIGTWFSAQAARLKSRLGFRLVLTVWETIPWREAFRWPRERRYRREALAAADLLLPATERARDALLLEGAAAERIRLSPPGLDVDSFAAAGDPPPAERHRVLSVGRLVWEKGHQDVLRALAALRDGRVGAARHDVEVTIVGSGPEHSHLRRYASELDLDDVVEFRPTIPYAQMPELYASASALVLASLPTRTWEEQFGMVLVEAMAAGAPVVTTTCGAIPDVVGADADLVAPGDWRELARVLGRVLAGPPPARRTVQRERLRRFSTEAAAERLRAAYALASSTSTGTPASTG
jgi:glycosyltransferase involved in cell wall biosynthesis